MSGKRSLAELPREIGKAFSRSSSLTRATRKQPGTVFLTWLAVSMLLAYFGMLLGAVWVEGEGFETLYSNFVEFYLTPPYHFIVGYTEYTPKFIGILVGAWTLIYIYQQTKISEIILGPKFKKVQDNIPYLQYRCKFLNEELGGGKITIKVSKNEFI